MLIPIHTPQVKKFARLSSYISTILTVIVKVGVICLIFVTNWLILKLCNVKLELSNYLDAVTIAFVMFIYNQTVRMILIYFLLYKEVQHITYKNLTNIKTQIASLTFYHVDLYVQLFFIIIAVTAFAYILKSNRTRNKIILFSSFIPLILLFVF